MHRWCSLFLEAFQWHGVKRGDAFAFYAGDIRVEGPHPFSSSGSNFGERAHPYGHVHRQHRAAPRHGRRTAGPGSGRDRAGGIHHSKQWRLDHVRQTPELTGRNTKDQRLGKCLGLIFDYWRASSVRVRGTECRSRQWLCMTKSARGGLLTCSVPAMPRPSGRTPGSSRKGSDEWADALARSKTCYFDGLLPGAGSIVFGATPTAGGAGKAWAALVGGEGSGT
jgi:hypothetical protein